jgi:uncharacterized protein (DUF608 family)
LVLCATAFALALSSGALAQGEEDPIGNATGKVESMAKKRSYNGPYTGAYLNYVAFPIGGIGAGMVCLEGTGALSHVSVRNKPDTQNEPCSFAAICIKKKSGNVARVLEGPVPEWKIFSRPRSCEGQGSLSYGLPRFDEVSFLARFPFGTATLSDPDIPLEVQVTGWSPFIPNSADDSSLPAGALEYRFKNNTNKPVEAVFSYNTKNFMAMGEEGSSVGAIRGGFVLRQAGDAEHPENEGSFAFFVDNPDVVVDHSWFRGGWFDALTLAWRNVQEGKMIDNPPQGGKTTGASFAVPLRIRPGKEETVRVMMAWYVPKSKIRSGQEVPGCTCGSCSPAPTHYAPWYAGRFADVAKVADYWRANYETLRAKSGVFRDAFYDTTLPPEVVEAAAANLAILKSPTVLRQTDGKIWGWEGCFDDGGCCAGSCTHVWNYAQAMPHLFPDLERTLRETEFIESQDDRGHQTFRAGLPIRTIGHNYHAAADGQLGGILKIYREWRISGDTAWLKSMWPRVRQSLDYCISVWDPRGKGVLEEPHHNTYDIEYWGPDGHCSSFYLAALVAGAKMGKAFGEDVSRYEDLLKKGRKFLETKLYNGEYFYQKIQTEGLNAKFEPLSASASGPGYKKITETVNAEGPKYQYGTGCLSDGVMGFWMAQVCGIDEDVVDAKKVRSNLRAIYKYNLKHDLSNHSNPQRPTFAVGKEGGLLLCTWPKGGALALPFVYSDEVWTGIEYQVASHLLLEGFVKEGLDVVRACRDRYDGRVRDPFDEYECGHWYARAMASYGLIQGLTGVRYDAVDKTLYIESRVGGNFRSFLSTATGFGVVGLKKGKPFLEVKAGTIDVETVLVSGKKAAL